MLVDVISRKGSVAQRSVPCSTPHPSGEMLPYDEGLLLTNGAGHLLSRDSDPKECNWGLSDGMLAKDEYEKSQEQYQFDACKPFCDKVLAKIEDE